MMSLVEWLAQPAGRVLSLALLHFVWQGLLIALLLAAVVELARIRRAATRYACSLVALLAMMVCPVGTLTWLSSWAMFSRPTSDSNEPTRLPDVYVQ